ncbi:hypothetical protein NPIL_304591 [Nephila pilipes]|uniref:Uncharacterized protein n=1 Tax=Nephila pilipes TaxID=299642 RepID=A0A8X6TZ40_NEPPI|nr:hypothetical protein NPIL_304591 [Nephila pilipes]
MMEESNLSIHNFFDASNTAYVACIFLNQYGLSDCSITSRIAPMKTITIPRLELMAAVIGARLFSSVKQALKLPKIGLLLDQFFHSSYEYNSSRTVVGT